MSRLQTHPEEGALLRYLDGELPGRKSRQVRRHLEACWDCRASSEELEAVIADCVYYRKHVLQAYLPAPPRSWADLTVDFDRIDSEAGAEPWTARLGRWFAAPRPQRWALATAAAVLLAAGIYYQFHETPSVQAATLLKRAVAVSATHPAPARLVRMRTSVKNRAAVPAMLRAARYQADAPLSARSFQEWRDGLPAKRDEVATVPNPEAAAENCFRIRTAAADGDLASASLTLRAADLHPVESRFEFRNSEWVEYSEISEASTTDGGSSAVAHLEAPMRRVVPSRPAALPSGESASISEELRVLAALHEIGADLGDPVEVTRSGGRVLVSGVGLGGERQREIRHKLEAIPNVSVDFSEPAAPEAVPDTPSAEAKTPNAPPARASAIQARLEKYLGGRAVLERFSAQALDAMENAMARVYALRSLAQRFPAGRELGEPDRALLTDLAREHARVLSSQTDELHRTLAPALVSLGGGSAAAQGRPAASASWQEAVENVFAASRRVERLVSTLLGVTPEPANAQVPAELQAAFADLRSALEGCRRQL